MSCAAARQQFEYINRTNINLSGHISRAGPRARAYLRQRWWPTWSSGRRKAQLSKENIRMWEIANDGCLLLDVPQRETLASSGLLGIPEAVRTSTGYFERMAGASRLSLRLHSTWKWELVQQLQQAFSYSFMSLSKPGYISIFPRLKSKVHFGLSRSLQTLICSFTPKMQLGVSEKSNIKSRCDVCALWEL